MYLRELKLLYNYSRLLVEELTYDEKVKYMSLFKRETNQDIFGDKMRIFYPVGWNTKQEANIVKDDVEKLLNDNGYVITDYNKGLALKKEKTALGKESTRIHKIGKVLRMLSIPLLKRFEEDKTRQDKLSRESKYTVVFSRHPYDIATMTTDRAWSGISCMNIRTGLNRDYVSCDVSEGTIVVFLVNTKDLKGIDEKNDDFFEAIGRTLLKPFYSKDGNSKLFVRENKYYGKGAGIVAPVINDFLSRVNKGVPYGEYRMVSKLYRDSISGIMDYNESTELNNILKAKEAQIINIVKKELLGNKKFINEVAEILIDTYKERSGENLPDNTFQTKVFGRSVLISFNPDVLKNKKIIKYDIHDSEYNYAELPTIISASLSLQEMETEINNGYGLKYSVTELGLKNLFNKALEKKGIIDLKGYMRDIGLQIVNSDKELKNIEDYSKIYLRYTKDYFEAVAYISDITGFVKNVNEVLIDSNIIIKAMSEDYTNAKEITEMIINNNYDMSDFYNFYSGPGDFKYTSFEELREEIELEDKNSDLISIIRVNGIATQKELESIMLESYMESIFEQIIYYIKEKSDDLLGFLKPIEDNKVKINNKTYFKLSDNAIYRFLGDYYSSKTETVVIDEEDYDYYETPNSLINGQFEIDDYFRFNYFNTNYINDDMPLYASGWQANVDKMQHITESDVDVKEYEFDNYTFNEILNRKLNETFKDKLKEANKQYKLPFKIEEGRVVINI